MEELLPFLAGLAYMGYKFYTNFQKGQEEARKRDPSKPHSEQAPAEYPFWTQSEETYVPENPAPVKPIAEKYHEPKYEPTYKEPMIPRPAREVIAKEKKSKIPHKVELYNPEVPAEEVVKNKAIHAPHKHQFVASQEEEVLSSDFDFKDAIVKEAILNRPQY